MTELPSCILDTDNNDLLHQLQSLCLDAGLTVSDDQLQMCLDHLLLVIEKNKVINLTRITSLEDALVLHILDSLLLLPYVDRAPHGCLLDMGTGAGYPGLPLHIVSGRSSTLLDSVGKKVHAVQEFIDQLHLKDVRPVHSRLEDYARDHRSQYSVVVARALSSLPVLVEYAAPFLSHGGLFIAAKARPDLDELRSGDQAADMCGMRRIDFDEFDLPYGLGHRTVVVYKSVAQPSIKLPRQSGTAKRSPLA